MTSFEPSNEPSPARSSTPSPATPPLLTTPDLRPARRAKNLTLTAAANHLGVWPARIGELELGRQPDEELPTRYRV